MLSFCADGLLRLHFIMSLKVKDFKIRIGNYSAQGNISKSLMKIAMVCFTSGYEFCHWRIHWKLFENHLIKWERPLEQFKINLTNSLELDLIWQPVSSKLLTFWLPVSLSLSAVTNSLPKSGCLSKKWSQTSQLECCLGLKSAPSSQLTSLSFNSFSVLHTSFFFQNACTVQVRIMQKYLRWIESKQQNPFASMQWSARFQNDPETGISTFSCYLLAVHLSLDIAPQGYNLIVLGTREVWTSSTLHAVITICSLTALYGQDKTFF